jgi:hypothetical protein
MRPVVSTRGCGVNQFQELMVSGRRKHEANLKR